MPRPKAHQYRSTIILGTPFQFRLTGDNLSNPKSVDLREANTGVTWHDTKFRYSPADLALYVSSIPSAVVHPLVGGAVNGDGSLTIVVTNGPDTPPGPDQTDQSPPMMATYYTSSTEIV